MVDFIQEVNVYGVAVPGEYQAAQGQNRDPVMLQSHHVGLRNPPRRLKQDFLPQNRSPLSFGGHNWVVWGSHSGPSRVKRL